MPPSQATQASLTGGWLYLYKTNDINLKQAHHGRQHRPNQRRRAGCRDRHRRYQPRGHVENSIIAQNMVGAAAQDLSTSAALIDLAYSLVQAPGAATLNNPGGSGNLLGQAALLGALQDLWRPQLHPPAGR